MFSHGLHVYLVEERDDVRVRRVLQRLPVDLQDLVRRLRVVLVTRRTSNSGTEKPN